MFDVSSTIFSFFQCKIPHYLAIQNSGQCNFMQVNQAGFTDIYDRRVEATSRNNCEEKCRQTMLFNAETDGTSVRVF